MKKGRKKEGQHLNTWSGHFVRVLVEMATRLHSITSASKCRNGFLWGCWDSFNCTRSRAANKFPEEPNASKDCIYSPYQVDAVGNLIGSGA